MQARRYPCPRAEPLSGLGVAGCEVLVDVVLADAVRLPDAYGGQLTTAAQAVDGDVGHPQQRRGAAHGDEPRPCVVRLRQWYHPSPPVKECTPLSLLGKEGLLRNGSCQPPPSCRERSAAAATASRKAARTARFSSTWRPAAVVPPCDVTA